MITHAQLGLFSVHRTVVRGESDGLQVLACIARTCEPSQKRSNYVTSFRMGELRETKADASIAKARWLQAKCAIIETRAIMGQCTWRKHNMRYGDRSCEKSRHRVCSTCSVLVEYIAEKSYKKRLLGILGENLVGTLGTLHDVVSRRILGRNIYLGETTHA